MKKILFLGTHGQYNIGDELLLETFLAQLGNQHAYTVNSYDPEFTRKQLGDAYQLSVFHTTDERFILPDLILKNDLLFFGGGSIIKELYASVGRNRYATLLMILGIVGFAKIIGRKKIVMSNIGVGPIETGMGLRLAKTILSLTDFVSVRDEESLRTCLGLGISSSKVRFVPDAVFVHAPNFFVPNPAPPQERNGELKIALNLNYDIENPESWQAFLHHLAEGFKKAYAQIPFEIHALPMQSGFKENHDLEILEAFRERIPEIKMVMHEPVSTHDMGAIIDSCDLIVSERLHTSISTAVMGKPFLPLVYDTKVREMAKILGMKTYALEINDDFSADMFAKTLLDLIDAREKIGERLQARTEVLRAELTNYFDELKTMLFG